MSPGHGAWWSGDNGCFLPVRVPAGGRCDIATWYEVWLLERSRRRGRR